jgi:hypothetical protein
LLVSGKSPKFHGEIQSLAVDAPLKGLLTVGREGFRHIAIDTG